MIVKQGTLMNYWNYLVWQFCNTLGIAELKTPTCRATSARDNRNSSTNRCASEARIFDNGLR